MIFFIIFTNAAPFKWLNLFFCGWYLSGLILKNLEYQGLTNVLWYFTSLYGSHLWQDQHDINCHKAKQSNHTNDHKSRGASEKAIKGRKWRETGARESVKLGAGSTNFESLEFQLRTGWGKKYQMDVFGGCLNYTYTFRDKYDALSWFQRERQYFMSCSVMHFLLEMLFLILYVCFESMLDVRGS